ncbi:MAG TPA: enoyl-CoA hydratase/isomerase family protein [Methylomirabilota bacterium]|jgi:enoyl-CoA hydratase/carnithine racemase|nr:enoyl-CoA hydratase/isomerase family protein [Methylomirabilota bacterium]
MTYETIRLEHADGVSTITLDRPPVNAVSPALMQEVLAALDELEAREATRCIVLRGAGTKAFSAGADLSGGPRAADEAVRFREAGRKVVDRIETIPKPVLAAIRGWCIGGGFAIAMACDVRLASSTAKFRTGDAYLGVVPSWGMSLVRLAHYIGRNRTLDMLILGEDMNAEQARDVGLVSRVIAEADFDAEVDRLAARVAGGAPITFRSIKESVRAQYWLTPSAAQEAETRWAEIGSASEDFREGMAAFRDRRAPVFRGR